MTHRARAFMQWWLFLGSALCFGEIHRIYVTLPLPTPGGRAVMYGGLLIAFVLLTSLLCLQRHRDLALHHVLWQQVVVLGCMLVPIPSILFWGSSYFETWLPFRWPVAATAALFVGWYMRRRAQHPHKYGNILIVFAVLIFLAYAFFSMLIDSDTVEWVLIPKGIERSERSIWSSTMTHPEGSCYYEKTIIQPPMFFDPRIYTFELYAGSCEWPLFLTRMDEFEHRYDVGHVESHLEGTASGVRWMIRELESVTEYDAHGQRQVHDEIKVLHVKDL